MDTNTEQAERERAWLLREKYDGAETADFRKDLACLEQGEPLAYLIGHAPFLDATIFLDSRPLIPRPETEYWTKTAIAEITACVPRVANTGKMLRVLDLCAGSGCVGIVVLKAVPRARGDFAEINAGHHPTISKNLITNNIAPSRARIFGGDLFQNIPRGTRYNFILANPPYLDPCLADRADSNVNEYEPEQALWGGTDGMKYISRILTETPHFLAKNGVLYIEHEPEQTEAVHTLADSLSYTSCQTHNDQFRLLRYTRLLRAS